MLHKAMADVAVLRAWKKRQIEERMLANLRPTADLIFAHPDGSAINPDYLSQVFDRHLAKSTLPSIRLHDLRHTHASILLKRRGATQSRERATGPRQPRLHALRLPAPAARHTSRRRQNLCCGCFRVRARSKCGPRPRQLTAMIEHGSDPGPRSCTTKLKQPGCSVSPPQLSIGGSRGERRGHAYRPVLRVEPTGSRSLSRAEFIGADLLRQYHRIHHVPLPKLRLMIDVLRDHWGAHPLSFNSPTRTRVDGLRGPVGLRL